MLGRLAEQAGQIPVAFLDFARRVFLPAGCWSSGHRPAQDARCAGVRNRVMSTPVSAMAS
jgi:hypothetical protein